MHTKNLNVIEKHVLRHFINENQNKFKNLTEQILYASIVNRKKSNTGFQTEFLTPKSIPKINTLSINTVLYLYGAHQELDSFVNFMLWFTFGRLNYLEGISSIGTWPSNELEIIIFPSYDVISLQSQAPDYLIK